MLVHAVGKPNIAMSSAGKSPRSALSERLLASNSPAEVAIDIPRPSRPSASASGNALRAAGTMSVRHRLSEYGHRVAGSSIIVEATFDGKRRAGLASCMCPAMLIKALKHCKSPHIGCTEPAQEPSPSSRHLRRRNSGGQRNSASDSLDIGRRQAASDDFGGEWCRSSHKQMASHPCQQ